MESGGEPLQALGRGLRAAEETEALALQSLHARLQARDCVRFAGGAEALEKRVRDTRAKAVQAVVAAMNIEGRRSKKLRDAKGKFGSPKILRS